MMQVAKLYRHPIKSHGREAVEKVTLTAGQTMPWDRTWAVTHDTSKFDSAAPAWARCRNFMIGTLTPALAGIWATLDEDSRSLTLTHRDLEPLRFCPDDPADQLRFLAWAAPLCPADRPQPTGIASVPGRGMTDSAFPSISIMNLASHADVAAGMATDTAQPLELERWRGNIWLDGAPAWAEHDWLGGSLRIGGAVLAIRERIRRCMHTAANPHSGTRDADTLGRLTSGFGHQDFGIYAEVIETGDVALGDRAEVL
ncbi:MAG: MOSC domain-containing protein [Sulfitobacter sp.]